MSFEPSKFGFKFNVHTNHSLGFKTVCIFFKHYFSFLINLYMYIYFSKKESNNYTAETILYIKNISFATFKG